MEPDGKFALRRVQRRPTPPKSVSGRGGNLVLGGLAAIFAELEFAGLLNWQCFAARGQATPYANLAALRPSVAAE